MEKSRGNFLYAQQVLESVITNQHSGVLCTQKVLESVPQTLFKLYRHNFERQFVDIAAFKENVEPILAILLAAKEPMSQQEITDCLVNVITEVEPQCWNDSFRKLDPYIRSESKRTERSTCLSLYHQSVCEWLQTDALSQSFCVNIGRGHALLGVHRLLRIASESSNCAGAMHAIGAFIVRAKLGRFREADLIQLEIPKALDAAATLSEAAAMCLAEYASKQGSHTLLRRAVNWGQELLLGTCRELLVVNSKQSASVFLQASNT